jgi:chemotaxis signal transduction protein
MSETSVATPHAASAATQAYILFGVAGTTYAIRSQDVLHIEMIEHVTPVPNAPPFVEGVVFSRGQVVPVINLRARFGFERAGVTPRSRLLVVQHEARRIGLLADESREFIRISDESIKPPQEAIGGLSGNYLEGVATLGQRIVLVLSVRDIIEAVPTAVS